MAKPTVLVEGVSKKFGLSLKSALKYGLMDSMRRMTGQDTDHNLRPGEFWALQDVNFSLEPGDALGIMGVNGSGKTTLLRILNGTYSPDVGKVTLRGRVGALIAAGAGFSPMLSGRENVYISGTLLGMKPSEIRRRFEEIVEFADLDEFIDMPVRNYSSGMSVRLGFAIAVIGRPEILLVDEVLAVGDIAFQKKCYEHIQGMRKDGTTIIFVSHTPGAVWSVCNKGLYLENSIQKQSGSVEQTIKAYDDQNAQRVAKDRKKNELIAKDYSGLNDASVECISFSFYDKKSGKYNDEIFHGDTLLIEVVLNVRKSINNFVLRLTADSQVYKNILAIDSYEHGVSFGNIKPGVYKFCITCETGCLRPGPYTFHLSVLDKNIGIHLFLLLNCATLKIKNSLDSFFYAEPLAVAHIKADYTVVNLEK